MFNKCSAREETDSTVAVIDYNDSRYVVFFNDLRQGGRERETRERRREGEREREREREKQGLS